MDASTKSVTFDDPLSPSDPKGPQRPNLTVTTKNLSSTINDLTSPSSLLALKSMKATTKDGSEKLVPVTEIARNKLGLAQLFELARLQPEEFDGLILEQKLKEEIARAIVTID